MLDTTGNLEVLKTYGFTGGILFTVFLVWRAGRFLVNNGYLNLRKTPPKNYDVRSNIERLSQAVERLEKHITEIHDWVESRKGQEIKAAVELKQDRAVFKEIMDLLKDVVLALSVLKDRIER